MKLLTKLEKFKISLKTNAKSGAKKPLEKTFVPPTLSPDSFHRQHDISGLLLEKNCNTNNYFGALFLYQFKRCPYSGKIRALLDRLGLWYTLLEVDPRSKKMLDWSSFATVPVLRIKSDRHKIAIGESNVIIDFLLDEALNYKLINRDIYGLFFYRFKKTGLLKVSEKRKIGLTKK
ncbi:Prostaglandin E synthase 2 [Bonamia ostreae]|uniref:Prostaglandin E synthase 2 n=1 Tax=Bonamia ostreae TaxID=126728 RepID=A0ABV2AFG5_9EUKA